METSLARCGYAVVDCETTGLFPGAHHRVIELAILQLDGLDGPIHEWSTLLNPGRDLGDADIHGIRARDVRDAPRFEDIVGTVLDLLAARVVVAHNARFDRGFLQAELARTGYDVAPLPTLCTIAMSHTVGAGGFGSRLRDCCRAVGIEVAAEHEALADARACADLFRRLAAAAVTNGWVSLTDFGCTAPHQPFDWPVCTAPRAEARPRTAQPVRQPSYLAHLVTQRPNLAGDQDVDADGYVQLLDRALEDRHLSPNEKRDLAQAAQLYDLPGQQLARVHRQYIDALCSAAVADNVITDREVYDLRLVAELLGVVDLERRLQLASDQADAGRGSAVESQVSLSREQLAGKSVCFTGKLLCRRGGTLLTREHAWQLVEQAGMVPAKSVTRGLDILVVADPETNSGKVRKARECGTRIIAETSFWPMIGVEVR
jgi:DNA polymerase-3 subunit epsilon